MSKQYVRVLSKIDCEWEGLNPVYRLYVNEELFSERMWRWTDSMLEEIIQLEAEPGDYNIRYELVEPHLAQLTVGSLTVDYGPAQAIGNLNFRIHA
jgi:hypothetical protein